MHMRFDRVHVPLTFISKCHRKTTIVGNRDSQLRDVRKMELLRYRLGMEVIRTYSPKN